MKNRLISAVIAAASILTLAAPLVISGSGCAASLEFRDRHGRAYAHRHYRDQEVYQHEDGRWYARRNNAWVVVEVR